MSLFIRTLHSLYELDEDNKLIRRLEGKNPPTPRFADDGDWKDYERIDGAGTGHRTLVHWPDGGFTMLSQVVAVEEAS